MNKKTIRDIQVAGKRVLVRVDFNQSSASKATETSLEVGGYP